MRTTSPPSVSAQSTSPMTPYGPRARSASIPLVFGLKNAAGVTVDLSMLPPGQALGQIATLYIDNSDCPFPALIYFPDTEATIDVPAYAAGYWPAITGGQKFAASVPMLPYVTVEQPAFTASINIQALNFPVPPAYSVQPPAIALAGAAQKVGDAGDWSEWQGTIAGTALAYVAMQLTNTTDQQITVSSTDIFGNGWSVNQGAVNGEELSIPPTLPGEAVTVTAAGVTGELDVVWRPVPFRTGSGVTPVAGSVSLNAGTVAIGSVDVSNFPATQSVAGTVELGAGVENIGTVDVANFPTSQAVTGTVELGAGIENIGTVEVANFPASQAVTGTVEIAEGVTSALSITATTVVKAAPGRIARLSVTATGTVAGGVYDAATTLAADAANLIAVTPTEVGVTMLNWPCAVGIVAAPGAGQTISVSYE